jgi:phosphatidylglycerophosphatase A
VLFRASDIIKPFPANKLEQLHGGVGVMADDLMAAIYANLALRAIIAFSHWVIG